MSVDNETASRDHNTKYVGTYAAWKFHFSASIVLSNIALRRELGLVSLVASLLYVNLA